MRPPRYYVARTTLYTIYNGTTWGNETVAEGLRNDGIRTNVLGHFPCGFIKRRTFNGTNSPACTVGCTDIQLRLNRSNAFLPKAAIVNVLGLIMSEQLCNNLMRRILVQKFSRRLSPILREENTIATGFQVHEVCCLMVQF